MAKNQLSELETEGLSMIPVESIDGRNFSDGRKDYIDYCSTNYLGFDMRNELHERGCEFAKVWGSQTSWSRLEADVSIYRHLEKRISQMLGSGEAILAHSVTACNFSLIPTIAEKGVIFCDQKVHAVVWEPCRLARDHGATLLRFKHQNLEELEALLLEHKDKTPKLIAVDGVYSISTEHAPILELQKLCQKYDAWLYVDDAHGFGILGDPKPGMPYGVGGRGIVAHTRGDYERTFYVSSFGKAFCSHTAFATVPHQYKESLRERSLQYIYSAPMTPYVIGMVEAVLDLNLKEGDEARCDLYKKTERFVSGLKKMNLKVENHLHFPVVFWEVGSLEQLVSAAKQIYSHGVTTGLRAYPVVPKNECGMRFGLTCLHTNEQIDRTLEIIASAANLVGVSRAA